MLRDFIIWAEKENWNITLRKDNSKISSKITERYKVPLEWLSFIANFSCCSNCADTKWFLTFDDFEAKEEGFQWNEFELQSLEAAASDNDWKTEIISYWDKHLPIIMCVDGEYSYYAINTDNGNVIYGCEPEYEESDVVADNFEIFIKKIIANEIVL